jgi:hypothetical protein
MLHTAITFLFACARRLRRLPAARRQDATSRRLVHADERTDSPARLSAQLVRRAQTPSAIATLDGPGLPALTEISRTAPQRVDLIAPVFDSRRDSTSA